MFNTDMFSQLRLHKKKKKKKTGDPNITRSPKSTAESRKSTRQDYERNPHSSFVFLFLFFENSKKKKKKNLTQISISNIHSIKLVNRNVYTICSTTRIC